jgi:2-dehydro-3-deoxy-L-rhamnonate dehydrogenase (NAD+)
LENRVVVSGAARGIGESTARKLAQAGARLALWDRDEARLERTTTFLKDIADVEAILYDQADLASVQRAAGATLDRFGAVNGLVNNAAIVGPTVPVWEFPPEDWDRVVQVNLTGVFYCCRTIIPAMLSQGAAGSSM